MIFTRGLVAVKGRMAHPIAARSLIKADILGAAASSNRYGAIRREYDSMLEKMHLSGTADVDDSNLDVDEQSLLDGSDGRSNLEWLDASSTIPSAIALSQCHGDL